RTAGWLAGRVDRPAVATTQDPQMVVPAGVLADRHRPSGSLVRLSVSPASLSAAATVLIRHGARIRKHPASAGRFLSLRSALDHAEAAQVIVIGAAEVGDARLRQLDDARGQRADELAVMADEDQCARVVLKCEVQW